MKRKTYTLLTFMLSVLMSVVCLVSCNKGGETTAKLVDSTDVQIVMAIEETDGNASAFDALKSLRLIYINSVQTTYLQLAKK